MEVESPHASCLDIALPGYALTDQLGVGGYGEVWRATAPGGLTKAVKFIFGHYSDKRATRELKSLEKIKTVRHPFLLSLERIEVLEDRLVIITELADGSLKDRYDQCVASGMPGIPRDELLAYLRDTADALDFLSAQHSLQHLDVKPENLLILAGHVKVADFGLVKDVANSQESLVGGLTPLYAAPEVFRGQPSQFSDQYSLAIVYQEMLTGSLPFRGATAAELTMQHLKDEPELSALPSADRYTLARALSKDESRRFSSCSEFVAALVAGGSQWHVNGSSVDHSADAESATIPVPDAGAAVRKSCGPVTQAFDEILDGGGKEARSSILLDVPKGRTSIPVELQPPELESATFNPAPTVVIGLGGVGGELLCQLRRQVGQKLNDHANVPALQALLLDSDRRSILAATASTRPGTLNNEETLLLALRRPQEYRDRSDRLQNWLSRRWLYNIPKSLNTEGLRPLGRLALIDHSMQTLQRIRMAISQAIAPESISQSEATTGLKFRGDAIRVYIVGAASGGFCGGTSFDIGFAVRSTLQKLGIEQSVIVGVFTHSEGSDQRSSELSRVNAFSWLTELRHVMQEDFAYPGDPSAGLPAFAAGVKPFDLTYLVRLADGLDDHQFSRQVEQVADYVYLDALTSTQNMLNACRNDIQNSDSNSSLRSFGVKPVAAASQQEITDAAGLIVQRVIHNWSGEEFQKPAAGTVNRDECDQIAAETDPTGEVEDTPPLSDTNQLVHGAAQLVERLHLNLHGLASTAREVLEARFESNLERYYLRTLASLQEAGQTLDVGLALQVATDFFTTGSKLRKGESMQLLGRPLQQIVGPLGMKLAGDLRQWLMSKLDDPEERLSGATRASDWLRDHFKAIQADARALSTLLGEQCLKVSQELEAIASQRLAIDENAREQMKALIAFIRLRMDRSAVHAAELLTIALLDEVKNTSDALTEFGQHLTHVAKSCLADRNVAVHAARTTADDGRSGCAVSSMVKACLADVASEVDRKAQASVIEPHGGLFETVMSHARVRSTLLDALQDEAVAAVNRRLGQWNLMTGLGEGNDGEVSPLVASAATADPKLLAYGGAVQRLLVVPETDVSTAQMDQLRSRLGSAALVAGQNVDFTFCCEAKQIPLVDMAFDIIDARRDYAEFATRVHARTDVPWKSLTEVAIAGG